MRESPARMGASQMVLSPHPPARERERRGVAFTPGDAAPGAPAEAGSQCTVPVPAAECAGTFSFWRDRTTSPVDQEAWHPVVRGVSKPKGKPRPLTARLQEPKEQGGVVVTGFADQEDFAEKLRKDAREGHFGDYRLEMAKSEESGARNWRAAADAGAGPVVAKESSFFKRHGRDMGFTITSPRRRTGETSPVRGSQETLASVRSTVQPQNSTSSSAREPEPSEQELLEEIALFERTHLSGQPAQTGAAAAAAPARAARRDMSDSAPADRGVEALDAARAKMTNVVRDAAPAVSAEAAQLLARHPSLKQLEVWLATYSDQGLPEHAAQAGGQESFGRAAGKAGTTSPPRQEGGAGAKKPSLATLPFSPPPAAAVSPGATRSPRSPRRDLPGTWDSRHPDAVDHESAAFRSGALTGRGAPSEPWIKYDPLNTHRGHGFTVGSPPEGTASVSDVTATGRNRQWKRQFGQSTWQGGKVAAIVPFYPSWGVYTSASFDTERGAVKAAVDRRELVNQHGDTGAGLDPNANVPVGPMHGRKRVWNYRYHMTYEESVSRSFDLDTNSYYGQNGNDTKVWQKVVKRPLIDENKPAVWPGTVSGDGDMWGARRNRVLPQGHTGDFRAQLVKQPDGTVVHRPLSASTKGKVQTGLDVHNSRDYIVENRRAVKGGRYFTDEPPLPASPSSPGPWKPPARQPGAGWKQGSMARASDPPPERASLPEQALPPFRSVAWLMQHHDHRGLDEHSIDVQWQPYSRDRGPTHDGTRWDHYLCPPGTKIFVRAPPTPHSAAPVLPPRLHRHAANEHDAAV